MIQDFREHLPAGQPVQILGDGPDAVLIAAEGFNLKAQGGKNIQIPFQLLLLLEIQGNDQRRTHKLGGYLPSLDLCHNPLVEDLFMGGVLVDDIQLVLHLHQPVGVKHLPDDPVTAPGFLG